MFYDKIFSLCNVKGISPSKLADDLNIGRSNVTNWKNGAIPQNRTIKKIADYFSVPIEYFSEGAEITTNQPKELTPHSMRHTHTSLLANKKAPPNPIKD